MNFSHIKFRLDLKGNLHISYFSEDMDAWRPLPKLSSDELHSLIAWLNHTLDWEESGYRRLYRERGVRIAQLEALLQLLHDDPGTGEGTMKCIESLGIGV